MASEWDTYDEDGNPEPGWPPKEEPDCDAPGCYDAGCSQCQPDEAAEGK